MTPEPSGRRGHPPIRSARSVRTVVPNLAPRRAATFPGRPSAASRRAPRTPGHTRSYPRAGPQTACASVPGDASAVRCRAEVVALGTSVSGTPHRRGLRSSATTTKGPARNEECNRRRDGGHAHGWCHRGTARACYTTANLVRISAVASGLKYSTKSLRRGRAPLRSGSRTAPSSATTCASRSVRRSTAVPGRSATA